MCTAWAHGAGSPSVMTLHLCPLFCISASWTNNPREAARQQPKNQEKLAGKNLKVCCLWSGGAAMHFCPAPCRSPFPLHWNRQISLLERCNGEFSFVTGLRDLSVPPHCSPVSTPSPKPEAKVPECSALKMGPNPWAPIEFDAMVGLHKMSLASAQSTKSKNAVPNEVMQAFLLDMQVQLVPFGRGSNMPTLSVRLMRPVSQTQAGCSQKGDDPSFQLCDPPPLPPASLTFGHTYLPKACHNHRCHWCRKKGFVYGGAPGGRRPSPGDM